MRGWAFITPGVKTKSLCPLSERWGKPKAPAARAVQVEVSVRKLLGLCLPRGLPAAYYSCGS